jgi:ribosomal protein S18 acetylase RimI-like enzyme
MIRTLTAADVPVYAAFRRRMLHDAPASFGSSPETDRVNDLAAFTRQVESPGFAVVGAFDPALGLVASAGLNRESQPKRRHIVTLWGVFTAPEARRRGHCRGVVRHAIDLCRTWDGADVIYLSVSESAAAARALYESLGFVAFATEVDAIRVEGRSYTETHMRLAL